MTVPHVTASSKQDGRRRVRALAGTVATLALGVGVLAVTQPAQAGPRSTPSPLVDAQTPSTARPVAASRAKTLVFSDEFNGTTLDTNKWVARSWARGGAVAPDTWSYAPANVSEHDGSLELKVGQTDATTFTGAEVDTAGKFAYTFGTLEARVWVPETVGHLAAVWLNTNTIHNVDGTARDGAEIDVVETNYADDRYSATVHWDGYGADHRQSSAVAQAPALHSGWHVFGLNWTSSKMEFTYDGVVVRTVTDPVLISQVSEYALLSHEVLDAWAAGSIHDEVFDSTSSMYVDYLRVWQ